MGTRCGELDAGVVLYLIQQKGMSPDDLVDLLYKRSGMLGLAGVSSDFRELLASDAPRARFAIELFCNRVARHTASLVAAIGGLDGIVFTAGVGDNAAAVRSAICRGCTWLARRGIRRSSQSRPQGSDQHIGESCRRLCDKNRREPDDRPPCAGSRRRLISAVWRASDVIRSRHDANRRNRHVFRR